MKNFICINGKRTELTAEQLKQLGIEIKLKYKTPFHRVEKGKEYYYIGHGGKCLSRTEHYCEADNIRYNNSNYFNDKTFAENSYLKELLNRKLLKFSYENGWKEGFFYDENIDKFEIYFNLGTQDYSINKFLNTLSILTPLFISEEIAQRAIDEIILPFEKEYPEFRW